MFTIVKFQKNRLLNQERWRDQAGMKTAFISVPTSLSRACPQLQKRWNSDQLVSHLSTRATERKIPPRPAFYPVALTQLFPLFRCCWFCVGNDRLVSWLSCCCFAPLVTQTLTNSGARQNETTRSLHILSHVCSASLWVWWSWEEHVKLKNCHAMNEHSRCCVKRLRRAAHFTVSGRTGTPQRWKISLWFMLPFVSSCGSSQWNQHTLTLDFTSWSRMLSTHEDHFQLFANFLIQLFSTQPFFSNLFLSVFCESNVLQLFDFSEFQTHLTHTLLLSNNRKNSYFSARMAQ